MHELRALLEEVTDGAPAQAPLAEVHRRVRRRIQRRRAATIGAATAGVVGMAAIATASSLVEGGQALRPTLLASASSPAAASAATPTSCATPPDLPTPQEVSAATWPSGARVAAARFPGASGCVVTVTLDVPEPAPEDVAAARERWGDSVELEGLNDNPTVEVHPTA
ncbi:MAG TPA: hypothetical protein VNA12_09070 [Mycobacteriales bacterium]|nr:hypothetical protein [Mycobacteriales bacterium]